MSSSLNPARIVVHANLNLALQSSRSLARRDGFGIGHAKARINAIRIPCHFYKLREIIVNPRFHVYENWGSRL
jgi:hypothetical protein